MVESKRGRGGTNQEPRYAPLEPESSGWGEWVEVTAVTAQMALPKIEGGETVRKTVQLRVVRNPETNELMCLPAEGQPIKWHDLRGMVSDEQLAEIEGALRGESRRRKPGYRP